MKNWLQKQVIKPTMAVLGMAGLVGISGCSSITNHPYDPNDPLQTVNRATFAFNQQFDKYLLKPTAQVYKAVTPSAARTGVNNFFLNLNEIPTTANYLLQAEPGPAYVSLWRLIINSTVGIGGLFDVASHMGLKRTTNDFGITLSKWGFDSAPYFVVPFLGPTNIRDGLSLIVDYRFLTVWPYMSDIALRNVLLGVDMVRIRTNLLENDHILDAAAFDKYTMTRDAYVQYRYELVTSHGGQYTQGISYQISDEELNSDLNTDGLEISAIGSTTVPEKTPKEKPIKATNGGPRAQAVNAAIKKTAASQPQPAPTH